MEKLLENAHVRAQLATDWLEMAADKASTDEDENLFLYIKK